METRSLAHGEKVPPDPAALTRAAEVIGLDQVVRVLVLADRLVVTIPWASAQPPRLARVKAMPRVPREPPVPRVEARDKDTVDPPAVLACLDHPNAVGEAPDAGLDPAVVVAAALVTVRAASGPADKADLEPADQGTAHPRPVPRLDRSQLHHRHRFPRMLSRAMSPCARSGSSSNCGKPARTDQTMRRRPPKERPPLPLTSHPVPVPMRRRNPRSDRWAWLVNLGPHSWAPLLTYATRRSRWSWPNQNIDYNRDIVLGDGVPMTHHSPTTPVGLDLTRHRLVQSFLPGTRESCPISILKQETREPMGNWRVAISREWRRFICHVAICLA